ncbi:COP9 signalosome protein [Malassezia pachydermatis]
MENQYYNAKAIKAEDPRQAIEDLQKICDTDTPPSEWGFKALKQQAKILFHMGRFEQALKKYQALLPYTSTTISRNYAEKSILSVLDYVCASTSIGADIVDAYIAATRQAPQSLLTDRFLTKIQLKLSKHWLQRQEWSRLDTTLKDILYMNGGDGRVDAQMQGTTMLELLSMEIQMHKKLGNLKLVRETYERALQIKNAIPHPRTMGMIREHGGMMHMAEKNWEAAQVDFFQAFRNYDEAGSPQRVQVLKYHMLAHMLMGSGINPFDSQEIKPYKEDPQILVISEFMNAYEKRDVQLAQSVLARNNDIFHEDEFIRDFVPDVMRELRIQYVRDQVLLYRVLDWQHLAEALHIPVSDVRELLLMLILDGRIQGKLDDISQELHTSSTADTSESISTADALQSWSSHLDTIAYVLASKQGAL